MPYPQNKRPLGVKALVALELLYGILGIVSGLLLMADPSGAGLGFTSDIKDRIPFHSFFPVGLFLFAVYGLGSLFLAYGSWTRKELFLGAISSRFGHHWAWLGGLALTGILVIWLGVEGLLIGLDYPATYMTVLIGALIFAALMLPSTTKYFTRTKY